MSNLGRHAQGQALVLFLGFAAAMIGMMLVAFNSGQTSNAKMRAMNAADAAAYSGAVWQARNLNFQAYINRAIIVNEVAIAQSVSVRSWLGYLNRFVSNISMITQFVPILGPPVKIVARGLDSANTSTQNLLGSAERSFRLLNNVEHSAQNFIAVSAGAVASDLAREVAKKNGAEISTGGAVLLANNLLTWSNFTDPYSRSHAPAIAKGDGRKRLREVALKSLDSFSKTRGWEIGLFPTSVRKQGGTDLIDYDAWVGLDSAALCVFKSCKTPLGWGGAQVYSTQAAVRKIGEHGEPSNWNRIDGALARRMAVGDPGKNRVRQLFPDYRDLSNLDKGASFMLPFAVEVVIQGNRIPSANSAFGAKAAITDGVVLEHDPHYNDTNSGVFALAEGCVTFERPHNAPRTDGATELPSLFNPYWRASMATEGNAARAIVDGAKKLVPIAAVVTGVGSCHI